MTEQRHRRRAKADSRERGRENNRKGAQYTGEQCASRTERGWDDGCADCSPPVGSYWAVLSADIGCELRYGLLLVVLVKQCHGGRHLAHELNVGLLGRSEQVSEHV